MVGNHIVSPLRNHDPIHDMDIDQNSGAPNR